LPGNGSIPVLPGWKYIHTPGHAPGHISLFREQDRLLIAGDAFVTTKNESLFCALTESKKISGPPKYFTYNWQSAGASVRKLAALEPNIVATGHGKPMRGEEMRRSLHNLAENFDELGMPSQGRYIHEPAYVNEEGLQSVPSPKLPYRFFVKLAVFVAALVVTKALVKQQRRNDVAHLF
jgi:glyoxylase-like metal-dependent hydrolase (beta-lactamase superfamily II)